MNSKFHLLIQLLNEKLRLYLTIGFGIFLFVLFFQPFPLEQFDFNNKLLFIAGFGAIVFLFMFLIKTAFPWFIENFQSKNHSELVMPTYLSGFCILAFTTVSFTFYIRYVGHINMSFYIVFKAASLCLVPPIILRLYDVVQEQKKQIDSLIHEKKHIQAKLEKYEEDILNKSIDFISETNSEQLTLLIADVVFIKSAENYVELVYKENDTFRKKLIRNTLKNIEQQIKPYSNFIRCHRICIVNVHYIEKLTTSFNNHWLVIKGYDDQLPVSRQYLLKLKEVL